MLPYMEYIYAVYEEKSFSKAAKRLFVSQPWLSSAVKKAEQDLHVSIFDRTTTPISLTPAGKLYIEHVEQIMAIESSLREKCERLNRPKETLLKIGGSSFFCTYVLPTLLADFRLENPELKLNLIESDFRTHAAQLLSDDLDILMEAERPSHPDLTSIIWAEEEIMLAVPASLPINKELKDYLYTFREFRGRYQLPEKPCVPISAFKDQNFILLQEGNDIYKRCTAICSAAGFSPKVSLYAAQMMTAYYLVCEGQGVAFLRSTIPDYVSMTESVVFYRLDSKLASRNVYLSYKTKESSPAKEALIDYLREHGIHQKEGHL